MIANIRTSKIISRFCRYHRRNIIQYQRTFTPLEYSWFSKHRSLIRLIAFIIFTSVCITVSIVVVSIKSQQSKNDACKRTFKSIVKYPIGFDSHPVNIVAADFDGDKHLDLVVANSGSDNIGIFFGYGNANFTDQTKYPTGLKSSPMSIVFADFNNDTFIDIVVANYGTNNIGVFFNSGNGNFRNQTTFSLGSARPLALAVGDFNNDTQPDIVVGNSGTSNIAILLSFNNGTFQIQTFIDIGYDSFPYALKVANFNNDIQNDIAVIDQTLSKLIILLGTSSGIFQNYTYSTGNNAKPSSLTIGDVNNDNIMDIVVANLNGNSIVIFLGYGNGTFIKTMTYNIGTDVLPVAIVSGHFNNDKNLDLIVANLNSQTINLFKGQGNGKFSIEMTHKLGIGSAPSSMVVGDFDENDSLDVAIATYGTNKVIVLNSYATNVYTTEWIYSTGVDSQPVSVTVGDFNNDNRLDIIVPNTLASSISIFFGLGNGNFSNQTTYFLRNNSRPNFVAVGDFNNDKNLDFVVGSTNISEIIIYLGNGNGTFKNKTSYELENPNAFSIDVADFNKDDNLDIVTAVYGMNSSGIFFGHGDGTFTTMTTYVPKIDKAAKLVTVGDFNSDTKPDFAILYYQQNIATIHLGDGNGSFRISMIIPIKDSCTTSLVVGDVNSDEKLDLIIAAPCSASVDIFFGYGNGTFGSMNMYSTGIGSFPCSVAVGHFNNDTYLDIAVVNQWYFSFSIFIGYGNGTFSAPYIFSIGLGGLPYAITFGDLNNNGQSDIIVATSSANNVHVFLTYYRTDFTQEKSLSTGASPHPSAVCIGDFNNDNELDIAVADAGDGNLQVFLNYEKGTSIKKTTYSTGFGSHPVDVATFDLNKDGRLDILVANSWIDNIYVFFGIGNGLFGEPSIHSTGYSSVPSAIAYGNFKNYSWMDVVIANMKTSNIGIFLGFNYPTFNSYQILLSTTILAPVYAVVADFNNDSVLDVAVSTTYENVIYVLLGHGNGTFFNPKTYSTGIRPMSLVAGDFNNDRKLDIAVANAGGFNISILLGYGNGTFAPNIQYSTGSASPVSIAVGDFNQDKNLDIAVANQESNSIGIFIGYGNGTFAEQISNMISIGSAPTFIAISDFNNDHILDIAVANSNSDEVGVLLGYGNGLFKNVTLYFTGSDSNPQSLAIGDLNQDGFMDIAVANGDSENIGIFYGYGNGTFSSQTIMPITGQNTLTMITITDMNQDNILDIIALGTSGGNVTIHILFGYGHGKFALLKSYPIGTRIVALSFIISDFNNDNRSDIAVVVFTYGSIIVMLQDKPTPFSNQITYSTGDGSGPIAVGVGDLNNDDKLDIAVANYNVHTVGVFLGHGDGTFDQQSTYFIDTSSMPISIAIYDFNTDKNLDIALADASMDSLIIIFGSGDGSFSAKKTYSTGIGSSPSSLAVADLNKDNRLDIVVTNGATNKILIFFGANNGTFRNPDSYSLYYKSQPQYVAIGDLDDDSWLDFAVANYGQDYVEIFLQTC